jgi:hypothetical protein
MLVAIRKERFPEKSFNLKMPLDNMDYYQLIRSVPERTHQAMRYQNTSIFSS